MRVLVSFYSKTGKTRQIANEIAKTLQSKNCGVVVHAIKPEKELKAAKYEKSGRGIVLVEPILDLQGFDLVFVGTPVWGFCPSPIVLSYLRQLKSVENKPFALFSTCTVLPGTTIKRMVNIIATKKARVLDSLTIKSIFELEEKHFSQARHFAEKIVALI